MVGLQNTGEIGTYSTQDVGAGYSPMYLSNAPLIEQTVVTTETYEGGISSGTVLTVLGGLLGAGGLALAVGGGGKGGGNSSSNTPNTSSGNASENNHLATNNTSQNNSGSTSNSTPSENPNQVQTTITVHYPNGEVITYSTTSTNPFSDNSIKYVVDTTNFMPISELENYAVQHQNASNHNINAAYKIDTDGDGVIDMHDKNPTTWDVSNRDLRMFSTLAYKDKNDLESIFNGNPKAITNINEKEFSNAAFAQELITNWTLLTFGDPGEGLQYAVFGNGKKTNGGYHNIVVAFRGTDGILSFSDQDDNLNINSGNIPEQANYLPQIAQFIASYNPDKIYSTGHSLGGYLAQWFAANTVKNSGLEKQFERSVLFNPAILNIDNDSAQSLKEARALSDQMTRTSRPDDSDTTNIIENYKTNSYVITNEWVGKALGYYQNSIFFDFKKDKLWGKHDLSSFYEQDAKLKATFTKGYRYDSHYQYDDNDNDGLSDVVERHIGTNLNTLDSDGDGFSDTLEVKLGANPLNAKQTPYTINNTIKALVQITNANGTVTEKEVTLQAEQENNQLVYRISNEPLINPNTITPALNFNSNGGVPFVSGGENNDTLFAPVGGSMLQGGNGKDTFVFNTSLDGSIDQLLDFSTTDDKIALSKQIFSAINEDLSNYQEHLFYDPTTGKLSYNATNTGNIHASHFASLPAALDLQKENFAII